MEYSNDNMGSSDDEAPIGSPTHWSVILAVGDPASPNHRAALVRFSQAYWYPVYAYIRMRGNPPHAAEDLTQGFFAWLLEKNELSGLKQAGGPFRAFLLTELKHFLVSE